MMSTSRILAAAFVAFAASSPSATSDDVGSDNGPSHLGDDFDALASWFRESGGTLDSRVGLGVDPALGIRGTVALEKIPADTLLLHCPASLMIKGGWGNRHCNEISRIESELRMGAESRWHVYLAMDDALGSRVPASWRRGGRAVQELQGLPPSGRTHRHVDWFVETCNGGEPIRDDVQMRAMLMQFTRATDRGMIPIWDLINHHNGLINTRLEADDAGGLSIMASIDIDIGNGIYNTYARGGTESEAEMFHQYGFVNDWPQIWEWVDLDRRSRRHRVVVFPDNLVALDPSSTLVDIFGNRRRTLSKWSALVKAHHRFRVLESTARRIGHSAKRLLRSLPTTIEEDEAILKKERKQHSKDIKEGRNNIDQVDVIKAIEYRLRFKKALTQAVEAAERGLFRKDEEEL